MKFYKIEGDIDFYNELKNEDDLSLEKEKVCLISNTPLDYNTFVTLECGHSFNYKPLFFDIMNHKKKFNSMEKIMLRSLEIRCPYCRNIQKSLLPYYENMGIEKVHGVNYFDTKSANNYAKSIYGECCYTGEEKCKSNLVNVLGDKTYCTYHKFLVLQEEAKKNKLEAKKKEKEAKEEAKKKEKEAKEEAKKKEKEAKEEAKKEKDVNMILCKQILKTGKNAGKECLCRVTTINETLCLRHLNKKIEI